jgi:hypothetical protein
MKTILLSTLTLLIFTNCTHRLGDLTMISTRNVDSKTEYSELKRGVKGKAKDLETAIDKAVKDVPGGEYMKNVIIYYNGKIIIEGDVWGISGIVSEKEKKETEKKKEQLLLAEKKAEEKKLAEEKKAKELEEAKNKFKTGDKVSWQTTLKMATGVIVGMDEDKALVKTDGGIEQLSKVSYIKLTKIE